MRDLPEPESENGLSSRESEEELIEIDQIEQAMLKVDPDLISRFNEPERKRLIAGLVGVVTQRTISIISRVHSGPLPAPQTLKEYGDVVQSAPERIIQQFELQANHRRQLEDKVITAQLKESGVGQWMGFIICFLFLGVSAALILSGHDVSGTILGTVDIVALVSLFVLGKRSQKEDLSEKDKE